MFSRVDITTSFISEILIKYTKVSKILMEDLEEEVKKKVIERTEQLSFSNILYKNIIENIVENIVFNEYLIVDEEFLFDEIVFNKLKNLIIEENRVLFPLRDGYSKRLVSKINWFLVPTSGLINTKNGKLSYGNGQ